MRRLAVLAAAFALAGGAVAGDLPTMVLDGTDVAELAAFTTEPVDAADAGRYSADQGGATVTLTLEKTADGWSVARDFAEPGMPPMERDVTATKRGDGSLATDDGTVVIRAISDGLLLREEDPADLIPSDLWIRLYRD